jgi:hypothetical protein
MPGRLILITRARQVGDDCQAGRRSLGLSETMVILDRAKLGDFLFMDRLRLILAAPV